MSAVAQSLAPFPSIMRMTGTGPTGKVTKKPAMAAFGPTSVGRLAMSPEFVTLSPLEQGPQQLRGAQPRLVPIPNPTLSESIVGRTAEEPAGTQIPTRLSIAAQRYVTSHRLKSTLYVAQKLLSKLDARAQSVRIDLVHDPEIADYSRLLITVGINQDCDLSFAYEQLLDLVAEEIPLQDGLHFIFTVEA